MHTHTYRYNDLGYAFYTAPIVGVDGVEGRHICDRRHLLHTDPMPRSIVTVYWGYS